jgi:hypothetical protein
MPTQERQLAERCIKHARDRFGAGWSMVSKDIHEMAVDHEILHVMLAQVQTGAETVEFIKAIYREAHFMLDN